MLARSIARAPPIPLKRTVILMMIVAPLAVLEGPSCTMFSTTSRMSKPETGRSFRFVVRLACLRTKHATWSCMTIFGLSGLTLKATSCVVVIAGEAFLTSPCVCRLPNSRRNVVTSRSSKSSRVAVAVRPRCTFHSSKARSC